MLGEDRLAEVEPDLVGVDVERGDELDVAHVVAAELDVHQAGDALGRVGVAVELDALHEAARAVARRRRSRRGPSCEAVACGAAHSCGGSFRYGRRAWIALCARSASSIHARSCSVDWARCSRSDRGVAIDRAGARVRAAWRAAGVSCDAPALAGTRAAPAGSRCRQNESFSANGALVVGGLVGKRARRSARILRR
mgnify:CR=1 FL=1